MGRGEDSVVMEFSFLNIMVTILTFLVFLMSEVRSCQRDMIGDFEKT